MRDHSKHIELSHDEAVSKLLAACAFAPGIETVAIGDSYGRTLASDAIARLDMPNCLTCNMDSVAVRWDDFESGAPNTSDWVRGVQWEFANTGVGMPEGFDTAIVVEHVLFSDKDAHVAFDAMPSRRYAGTSPAGSRMHAGDVLVPAGTVITPLLAAHIASGNNPDVPVVAKPKVAFIPTGNELVPCGSCVPWAKNIDSNTVLMKGKIEEWGGEAILFDIVPDDPELLSAALHEAVRQADIIVLNAGSSKGSDDYSIEMLEQEGSVLYHQTNHGPGHHSSAAVFCGKPVVGISGPPGGAAFTADFYVKPVMRKFLGMPTSPFKLRVRLAAPFGGGRPKPDGAAKAQAAAQGAGPDAAHFAKVAANGEDRPRENGSNGSFFAIQQMKLSQGADGMIEAVPCSSAHPAPLEAETAMAYYELATGMDARRPEPGDMIEVEMRCDF